MSHSFFNSIQNQLDVFLKQSFSLDSNNQNTLCKIGEDSLKKTLKQYVLKNGTQELEQILYQKTEPKSSKLSKTATENLLQDLDKNKMNLPFKNQEIAEKSIDFLIKFTVESFQSSSFPKNTDGICGFLGIDKSILKAINSPVGKLFGKFF